MRTALLAVAVVGLSSCGAFGALGSIPSSASCDGRPSEQACVDLLNNKNNQFESTLKALCVGTFSTTACNHTGALGGCRCDSCENGKTIEWLFPDSAKSINTVDDVKKACGSHTFVDP